jgi:hypothetical protein
MQALPSIEVAGIAEVAMTEEGEKLLGVGDAVEGEGEEHDKDDQGGVDVMGVGRGRFTIGRETKCFCN